MNDDQRRHDLANEVTLRGIALLTENTPASLFESVRCFDEAIALRQPLPIRENPWFCYGLIAGWMNRGDALTRLGSEQNLADALRAYEEALELLALLPLDANPLFRTRLAIAWSNRGITLEKQRAFAEAARSFEQAIASGGGENDAVIAAAYVNRSRALLQLLPPQPAEAWECAKHALHLLAGSEQRDLLAAETGLKARHVLCRAITHLLAAENRAELMGAATDAVEEGVKLARLWESRGHGEFRDLLTDLFRFGAHAYRRHQPHFLMEFLLETLDPAQSSDAIPDDPALHAAAAEAIWRAFSEIQRDSFRALGTPRFDELLRRLRELRVTEEQLARWRSLLPQAVT